MEARHATSTPAHVSDQLALNSLPGKISFEK